MLSEAHTAAFLLVFGRCAAWAQAAPITGDRVVPARIRVLLAAAIALPLSMARTADYALLASALPFEILFGLLVGATARLVLAGAEAGGQIAGMQLGLGFAGTFDPLAQEQSLPTRRLAYVLAALAFIGCGGFEEAVRVLALPMPHPETLLTEPTRTLAYAGGDILASGARIAGPLIAAGIVANVTMAFASKAAPSLNVFSVMLAVFLAVGGAVLLLVAPQTIRIIVALAQTARSWTPF